jgi:hypothetical protein
VFGRRAITDAALHTFITQHQSQVLYSLYQQIRT